MKNKQHEHILKAFLASKIPAAVYEHAPELVAVDSVIGGYCTRLLRRNKALECSPEGLITRGAGRFRRIDKPRAGYGERRDSDILPPRRAGGSGRASVQRGYEREDINFLGFETA